MHKFTQIEKTLALTKNMFLPLAFFAFSLFAFYALSPFSPLINQIFHNSIYILACGSFMTLLYFNRGKSVFLLLTIILGYILTNLIKQLYINDFLLSPAYLILETFVSINLLVFYFFHPRQLMQKTNLWILLTIFIEFAIGEIIIKQQINLGIIFNNINLIPLSLFITVTLISFINATKSGGITDYNLFFAFICQTLAFYYSSSVSGLTIFTFTSILCIISAIVQNIYTETYTDTLTNLYSRSSYIIHSKSFPLKYSIGLIKIDDYDKIGSNFGKRIQNTLTKLIANTIIDIEKDENIYRYNTDEFIIVYKNMDKKEGFERLETIRRTIASSLYEYSIKRNALKLTVSVCIAEKKRSDATSFEVLMRADKALQRARSFSHNVSHQA